MRRTFLSGLALAALLAAAHGPASAHPIIPPGAAYLAHADEAHVVKVGWRAKRRHAKRFRYNRRHRGHGYGRFRGGGRSSRMGPYVMPGVASMIKQRCRPRREELLPGGPRGCN
ncbi:hypothetical protein GGD81_001993 [Rhodobium orientis]|uniref:Uncharacterized protein n=1 Tax=Rhodobium orientis TaxID=34017 RepID=A0A327JSR6_9HYPH|nr:hypothetical protein [Rhodobium orientis]MBB4302955.1 hypothetical protein [Rhodobium orientis]MBK5949516.1 hypothetical protein [Rhodobium orientis]RAI29307.1 hypothetical protein CH339_03205 [Rhodobium orientis]